MTNIENLLPKYYKNSKYMHGLLHPCDVEFDRLYDKLDRTLKNLSVDDADETGIEHIVEDLDSQMGHTDLVNVRKTHGKTDLHLILVLHHGIDLPADITGRFFYFH